VEEDASVKEDTPTPENNELASVDVPTNDAASVGEHEMVFFTRKLVPDHTKLDSVFQEVIKNVAASELEGVNSNAYRTVVVAYDEPSGFQPCPSIRSFFPNMTSKVCVFVRSEFLN
jgi:hypothetical protein